MKISGWTLRLGNRLFNRTRRGSGIGRGVAAVGRYVSPPLIGLAAITQVAYCVSDKVSEKIDQITSSPGIALFGIFTSSLPGIALLGIFTSSLILLGLSRLERNTGWEIGLAKKYIEEAEKAKREKDYNALFLAALALKRMGDRLGETSYLAQYRDYRSFITEKYNVEYAKELDQVEGPIIIGMCNLFKEYSVAVGLDNYKEFMKTKKYDEAESFARFVANNFKHPLGKEARIEALKEQYKLLIILIKKAEAEKPEEDKTKLIEEAKGKLAVLFELGYQKAAELRSVLYAKYEISPRI